MTVSMRQFLPWFLMATSTAAAPFPAAASLSARAPAFVFRGDAPFSVKADTMAEAISCPEGEPNARHRTVLLVHGTGSTGSESFGAGYVPALKSQGFTPCYVDLPDRAMNDMQVSSEYVAYAIHHLSAKSGGNKIHALSHSQGGPDTQWALRFWPSTRRLVKSFVALSPDFSGVNSKSAIYQLCANKVTNGLKVYLCSAGLWQQAIGSNYYKALNFRKGTFVPTTAVYSKVDDTVPPPDVNAHLPGGAVSMPVQALCPDSQTSHDGMVTDPAAYLLALNAFKGNGFANERVVRKFMPKDTCSTMAAPGMDANLVTQLGAATADVALGILLSGNKTSGEPPLKRYAQLHNQ